jgi:hypothetical protein
MVPEAGIELLFDVGTPIEKFVVRVIIYIGLQNPYKRKCVRTYMESNHKTIMLSNILPK